MAEKSKYEPRLYRETMGNTRWKSFRVCYMETDLWIAVSKGFYSSAVEAYTMDRIRFFRSILETHITAFPRFLLSLIPLTAPPPGTHPLLRSMYAASMAAGTGPMSAVAGAVAEYICRDLISEFEFPEAIVENGGDIFMKLTSPATISVYAGTSPLSNKMGLYVSPEKTPLGLCCSSGTVGHSLSLGKADACVIASESGAVADAYATAFCNKIRNSRMIGKVTDEAMKIPAILAVVIIKDHKVGMGGKLEMNVLW